MTDESVCKRCGNPTVIKDNMFYWEGTYFKGRVCERCNTLNVYEKEPTIFDVVRSGISKKGVEDD